MNESTINTRYAKALFKLAKEKKLVDKILGDMKLVFEAFSEIHELKAVIEDPVIKTSKKAAIVQSIFKSKLDTISMSFLNLLLRNKREFYIKGVCQYFIDLVKKDKGIKSVKLTTAYSLDKKSKDGLESLIKSQLNSKIELTEEIDEEIIGGFIIRIDDNQYDSSVRSALNKMQKNLIEIEK